jgi:hypothetical protein
VLPTTHDAPSLTQVPLMQQLAPPHRPPLQHGCPGPPHCRHRSDVHTLPGLQRGVAGGSMQQACPDAPHGAQLPTTQRASPPTQLAVVGLIE